MTTLEWGVDVTLVELKDIQLPDSMKRAMARQAEAEREKRAKIIAAEGESMAAAALGDASDTMMAHPLALQLRNLQTLVELGVDNNTTVVFPAPLMSAIGDVGTFLARETAAASTMLEPPILEAPSSNTNRASSHQRQGVRLASVDNDHGWRRARAVRHETYQHSYPHCWLPQSADLPGGVLVVHQGQRIPRPDGRTEQGDHLVSRAR